MSNEEENAKEGTKSKDLDKDAIMKAEALKKAKAKARRQEPFPGTKRGM